MNAPIEQKTTSADNSKPRLSVRELSTSFMTDRGRILSVSDVSFDVHPGQTLALVGESGSGKSVTSLGIMGLHAKGSQAIVGGEALFTRRDGTQIDLLQLPEAEKRKLRGNELAMIFQEPMTSLNPVLTVGEQIAESVRLHLGFDRTAALAHAKRMLDLVEIPAAERRIKEYPHQLSGGMRQRVMIALAMACNPALLIADEPTTALDVTIQAQILSLIGRLQKETGMSVLFITHNLGVVAQYANRVAVMYFGRIVETGTVGELFARPVHPYTKGLLSCLPAMAVRSLSPGMSRPRLNAISGQVCSPFDPPSGCAFAPRCPECRDTCHEKIPPLLSIETMRHVRCFRHGLRGEAVI